jgi:hypothetical protein
MKAVAVQIEQLMARARRCETQLLESAARQRRLRDLQSWQARRLASTYDDLRQQPRYRQALEFFLSDLYGPGDFSLRERQLARAWRHLQRALPATLMEALARAVELQVLTLELDLAMVAALPPGPITAANYRAAYCAVGRRSERERQIELIIRIGQDLDGAVRRRWVGLALRAAHLPAHAAGFAALQDFLERGYAAFQAMQGSAGLLKLISEREHELMEALLSAADAQGPASLDWCGPASAGSA